MFLNFSVEKKHTKPDQSCMCDNNLHGQKQQLVKSKLWCTTCLQDLVWPSNPCFIPNLTVSEQNWVPLNESCLWAIEQQWGWCTMEIQNWGRKKLPLKTNLGKKNGLFTFFFFWKFNLLHTVFFILNFDFDPSFNQTGSTEPQFGIL